MSYLNLPTKNDLHGTARDLLVDAENRWGYTPNIVRAYALAPKVMVAEDVWSKGVMYDGFLPRELKEAIATVVSTTNDCSYCANSHAHAMTLAGGDTNDAIACKQVNLSEFKEKDRVALEFTQRAVKDPKSIQQEDIDALKEYYSEGEIVEISTVIQQFMGYNWFVTILGLKLEVENPMSNYE